MFAKSLAAAMNDHMAFNQDFLLTSTLTSATPRQTRVIRGVDMSVNPLKREGHHGQPRFSGAASSESHQVRM